MPYPPLLKCVVSLVLLRDPFYQFQIIQLLQYLLNVVDRSTALDLETLHHDICDLLYGRRTVTLAPDETRRGVQLVYLIGFDVEQQRFVVNRLTGDIRALSVKHFLASVYLIRI